jgi:predicted secreted protein
MQVKKKEEMVLGMSASTPTNLHVEREILPESGLLK